MIHPTTGQSSANSTSSHPRDGRNRLARKTIVHPKIMTARIPTRRHLAITGTANTRTDKKRVSLRSHIRPTSELSHAGPRTQAYPQLRGKAEALPGVGCSDLVRQSKVHQFKNLRPSLSGSVVTA